jgi:hypothetical protein
MSAQSVLERVTAQGIALHVVDGRIRGRGAKPNPAFLAELREHEAEIVALLASREAPALSAVDNAARRVTANNTPAPTPLPQEVTKPTKPPPVSASWPEPKITGKPPFGVDHVPNRYQTEWKALLAGCPPWAAEWQWTTAIFDCKNLFGEWGGELLRLSWQPNDIFGRWHGLFPPLCIIAVLRFECCRYERLSRFRGALFRRAE